MTRRTAVAKRYRKFREDATIASVERSMEKGFGFPQGSVKLVYPSGRKARTDSTVGILKKKWNEA